MQHDGSFNPIFVTKKKFIRSEKSNYIPTDDYAVGESIM